MELQTFSKKQLKVLTWWQHFIYKNYSGVIADGAIRSGKTLSMTFGFLLWSMATYNECKFAICGNTIHSVTKNIVNDFINFCHRLGLNVKYNRSQNRILVTGENVSNEYFIYGGGNEQSQDLIQGMTLAGVLFDEVALQKESFVNQATGRCSVAGSKYWFNCNPDSPTHFFKVNWINEKEPKKLLYLHFTMDDNLSLDRDIKERYKSQYTGVFYDRYIKGLWTAGQGAIYDMFDKGCIVEPEEIPLIGTHYVSIDWGVKNATAFLRILQTRNCSYIVDEYYYSGRDNQITKTNAEYCKDLMEFCDKDKRPYSVIIDPSAASFKAELKGRIVVKDADNEVLNGISKVGTLFATNKLKVSSKCKHTLDEIYSYKWADKNNGKEEPIKENDHTLDCIRYYVNTILKGKIL